MEDKVRRESKHVVECMFKAKDSKGIGAIPIKCMESIIADLCPVYDPEELEEMVQEVKKDCSYTVKNPVTRKFEVLKEKDTIDFPCAFAIAVHFLAKIERKNNRAMSFAGRALIRLDDLPVYKNSAGTTVSQIKQPAKRMY